MASSYAVMKKYVNILRNLIERNDIFLSAVAIKVRPRLYPWTLIALELIADAIIDPGRVVVERHNLAEELMRV